MRLAKVICALVVSGSLTANALGGIVYSTGFEAPVYSAGSSPLGTDGWAAGSGSGNGFQISSAQAAAGSQSLMSNNTSLNAFYSVRHDLGGWTAASGLTLQVAVDIYLDPSTQANRVYGLFLGSGATSTLGGTVLGLTIDGAGNVRAGTTWSNTYTNSGLIGTAAPGTYLGRWLTITMEYDPATGAKNAKIAGFSDTVASIGGDWTAGAAPVNLNIGTDYFSTSGRAGIAYFDNLVISAPEPGSVLALLGVGFLAMGRRR